MLQEMTLVYDECASGELLGGLNLYAYGYGNQNPLRFTDPLGLDPLDSGSGSGSGGFTPVPSFSDVFFRGTAANNAFVMSVNQIGDAVKNFCGSNDGDKDPCKGLRDQLRDHERKLREYMANPMAADNKGFLAGALAKNDQSLYDKIYWSRIASLQGQIANFKKLLEECERKNGR